MLFDPRFVLLKTTNLTDFDIHSDSCFLFSILYVCSAGCSFSMCFIQAIISSLCLCCFIPNASGSRLPHQPRHPPRVPSALSLLLSPLLPSYPLILPLLCTLVRPSNTSGHTLAAYLYRVLMQQVCWPTSCSSTLMCATTRSSLLGLMVLCGSNSCWVYMVDCFVVKSSSLFPASASLHL